MSSDICDIVKFVIYLYTDILFCFNRTCTFYLRVYKLPYDLYILQEDRQIIYKKIALILFKYIPCLTTSKAHETNIALNILYGTRILTSRNYGEWFLVR